MGGLWLLLLVGVCHLAAASPLYYQRNRVAGIVSKVNHLSPWHRSRLGLTVRFETNATIHFNTTSESEPCMVAFTKMIDLFQNDEKCGELSFLLESFDPDMNSVCANDCFGHLIDSLQELHDLRCFEDSFDPTILRRACDSSQCSNEEAQECVSEWLRLGCPEDATDLFERCDSYAICAYHARHLCVPIVVPEEHHPRILRNCSHLNNCTRHGHCSINSTCVCDKGYGRSSHNVPQDCSEYLLDRCPNQCGGHGHCVLGENGEFSCNCFDGFFGNDCMIWDRCESLNYCNGHGRCTQPHSLDDRAGHCVCDPGYSGPSCSIRHDTCENLCSAHGICHAEMDGSRNCECDAGFENDGCDHTFSFCPRACSGFGSCGATGNCTCAPFAFGNDCSNVLNECSLSCGRGYCRSGNCKCEPLFKGAECNIYDSANDHLCRDLNFCSGYGICRHSGSSAICTCFEGYKGRDCSEIDAVEKCPNYCNGNGKCSLRSDPRCVCKESWTGDDCSTSLCGKGENGLVCSGRGVCEKNEKGFACSCDKEFKNGALGKCEEPICPHSCSGSGKCDTKTGLCTCNEGFLGDDCSEKIESAPTPTPDAEAVTVLPCLNDCSQHGLCNDGICSCLDGFTGVDCSIAPALPEDGDEQFDNLETLLQFGEGLAQTETNLEAQNHKMAHLWD